MRPLPASSPPPTLLPPPGAHNVIREERKLVRERLEGHVLEKFNNFLRPDSRNIYTE